MIKHNFATAERNPGEERDHTKGIKGGLWRGFEGIEERGWQAIFTVIHKRAATVLAIKDLTALAGQANGREIIKEEKGCVR